MIVTHDLQIKVTLNSQHIVTFNGLTLVSSNDLSFIVGDILMLVTMSILECTNTTRTLFDLFLNTRGCIIDILGTVEVGNNLHEVCIDSSKHLIDVTTTSTCSSDTIIKTREWCANDCLIDAATACRGPDQRIPRL